MTISVEIPEALQRFSRLVKPAGRRMLFSAAGNAVSNLINRHLKRISPTRHRSANRLGATPTGHLEQRPTFHATSNYAEVVIPIPGINRAFKDLTITPKDAPFLTLPLNAVSYGKRAATVRSHVAWAAKYGFSPKFVIVYSAMDACEGLYGCAATCFARPRPSVRGVATPPY